MSIPFAILASTSDFSRSGGCFKAVGSFAIRCDPSVEFSERSIAPLTKVALGKHLGHFLKALKWPSSDAVAQAQAVPRHDDTRQNQFRTIVKNQKALKNPSLTLYSLHRPIIHRLSPAASHSAAMNPKFSDLLVGSFHLGSTRWHK